MEKVTAYKSFNGRLFETEEKCVVYEKKLRQYPKIKESTQKVMDSYTIGGIYSPVDIVCHITERWEKPYSAKKVSKYFIVGGKYKFVDLYRQHEHTVMKGGLFAHKNHSMNWYLAFRYFAEQILLGKELNDEFVKTEVEKINDINKVKLVAEIIEKDKKWKIDNPLWHSGAVAPYTFTIEKIA